MSKQPLVGILAGSESDLDVIRAAASTLDELGISYELRIASAHRTPARVREYAEEAEGRGIKVIICAAGMAAHLAGAVAATTDVPVIGVPMPGGVGDGLDALLSTVQMPAGVPVATVAVGKAGAHNAGLLAARILALYDEELRGRLRVYRDEMAAAVEAKNAELS
ncbi:MAG TPA: 5-(carboxyamino)imidazole ribonucleotide mutase [bacterium]|nr:5-(carboxyamino)imidazole ribonucleotide mutase [bacterium]